MNRAFNPPDIAEPLANYSHGVEVGGNSRWLYAAGQIGLTLDGGLPDDFEGQARVALSNLTAILAGADMGWRDVVKITSYITDPANIVTLRRVRGEIMGDALPASTLLIVAGLANPAYLVEIELVAAKG